MLAGLMLVGLLVLLINSRLGIGVSNLTCFGFPLDFLCVLVQPLSEMNVTPDAGQQEHVEHERPNLRIVICLEDAWVGEDNDMQEHSNKFHELDNKRSLEVE